MTVLREIGIEGVWVTVDQAWNSLAEANAFVKEVGKIPRVNLR
jgi:hypothetical protein